MFVYQIKFSLNVKNVSSHATITFFIKI